MTYPEKAFAIAPGVLVACAIGAVALAAASVLSAPGASPLIGAVVLGIAVRNLLGLRPRARVGLTLTSRAALRVGVALLGFQLTLGELLQMGSRGAVIAASSVVATFYFTRWLGGHMRVERRLTSLIAVGTSICGASAIVGANTIARADEEDVSYAVATVTILGLMLMLLYPYLSTLLLLSSGDYGIWVGSSVHEVAQVVAAGFQRDALAGETATVVKLTRVLLLAPGLFLAWVFVARESPSKERRPSIPWFVVAFALATTCNSIGLVPHPLRTAAAVSVPIILTVGLAAVGMETDARALATRGARPFVLGLLATLFVAALSLSLVTLSTTALMP